MAKTKNIPMRNLKALLKKIKNPEIVNKQLKAHLKSIVNELIKKSLRKEALEILYNTNRERIGEFFYYYYSGSSNVACMVLDTIKDELVRLKKMKQGKKDSFGGVPF